MYLRLGDWPVLLLAAGMLVASLVLERRESGQGAARPPTARGLNGSHVEEHGDRDRR